MHFRARPLFTFVGFSPAIGFERRLRNDLNCFGGGWAHSLDPIFFERSCTPQANTQQHRREALVGDLACSKSAIWFRLHVDSSFQHIADYCDELIDDRQPNWACGYLGRQSVTHNPVATRALRSARWVGVGSVGNKTATETEKYIGHAKKKQFQNPLSAGLSCCIFVY